MFLFDMLAKKSAMPEAGKALPGRATDNPHRGAPFRQRRAAEGTLSGRG